MGLDPESDYESEDGVSSLPSGFDLGVTVGLHSDFALLSIWEFGGFEREV